MDWKDVGSWLEKNAGTGAALVGSLITGNVPGAVAAGVSLVASATGTTDPAKALATMQQDPATVIRLQELATQNEANIREHIRAMTELRLKDAEDEQQTTAKVTISGDNAEDIVVKRTRPLESWLSLIAAIAYVFVFKEKANETILGFLLALPLAYAGLRQIGKGVDSVMAAKVATTDSGS